MGRQTNCIWTKTYRLFSVQSIAAAIGMLYLPSGLGAECTVRDVGSIQDELKYKKREDGRCEGLFVQPIAQGVGLEVISVQRQQLPEELGDVLCVSWPIVDAEVALRGISLRDRLYYRMDHSILHQDGANTGCDGAPEEYTYRWPTNVLKSVPISAQDLGVSACVVSCEPGQGNPTFLPVTVFQEESASASENADSGKFLIMLLPHASINEIYYALERLKGKDLDKDYREQEALDIGYYPAKRPLVFAIPRNLPPLAAGDYRLTFLAELQNGLDFIARVNLKIPEPAKEAEQR